MNLTTNQQIALKLYQDGNIIEATKAFNQLIERNSDDFVANIYLGTLHAAQKRYTEARIHLERAVQLRPDLGISHAELARFWLMNGEINRAIDCINEAIKCDPSSDNFLRLAQRIKLEYESTSNIERLKLLHKPELLRSHYSTKRKAGPRNARKLGIIQSRGLGDIIIALPIAKHYFKEGWDIHWPVSTPWVEQLDHYVPWINWYRTEPDGGDFFLRKPLDILQFDVKVDAAICLYHWLTAHPDLSKAPWFQHVSFDKAKYIRAGVDFKKKWTLSECIRRDRDREEELYETVIGSRSSKFCLTHLKASALTASCDLSWIEPRMPTKSVTELGWVFDWIGTIDRASVIVMTDSSFANLTDQLGLGSQRFFVPLHNIQLTPVHGHHWQWLENLSLNPSTRLFGI